MLMDAPTKEDWELLGLLPGASSADVKAAWKRLSKQTHPDVGGTDALFRRVKDAYERVLASVEYSERHADRGEPAPSSRSSWAPPKREPTGGRRREDRSRPSGSDAGTSKAWEPPRWEAPKQTATSKSGPERPRKRRYRSLARVALLSGSWPSTSRGVFVGLVGSVAAGLVIHLSMGGLPAELLEWLPGGVVIARVIALPERAER